jgi:hypothetical protein
VEKMEKRNLAIGVFIAGILVILVFGAMPAIAKDKVPTPGGSADIAIDNGVINIEYFGETHSYPTDCDWFYRGGSNLYDEWPLMSYGENNPIYLSDGNVHLNYPATGVPDVWYDAIVGLDLDGDESDDINVTRSIMVPSDQKYFIVRYCIENIKGSDLDNFTLFQGVDYDAGDCGEEDEAGYAADFVWVHDLDDGYGTYVGFKGDKQSAHHDVGYYDDMWDDLEAGLLNDVDYYDGDPAVGLEWDLGTLNARDTTCLNVTFFFSDQAQAPTLTPTGLIALVGLLSTIAAVAIVRKRR